MGRDVGAASTLVAGFRRGRLRSAPRPLCRAQAGLSGRASVRRQERPPTARTTTRTAAGASGCAIRSPAGGCAHPRNLGDAEGPPRRAICHGRLWVPIIRSWALTRGFALHPGTRNRYEIRYTKTQHQPPARQVNDHGRVSGTHRDPHADLQPRTRAPAASVEPGPSFAEVGHHGSRPQRGRELSSPPPLRDARKARQPPASAPVPAP